MILLNTSVWIDHLRQGDAHVVATLQSGLALTHPFVIGELACGNLKSHANILGLLATLPKARVAQEDAVLYFIAQRYSAGRATISVRTRFNSM